MRVLKRSLSRLTSLPLKPLLVCFSSCVLVLSALPAANAVDSRIIDVVTINWPGSRPNSVTTDQIEIAINTEVSLRWRAYTTAEGGSDDASILFTHGQTLRAPIALTRQMECEGSSATSLMNTIRQEAYQRLGIEQWNKRYLIILTPYAGCIWSGRAMIGNKNSSGGVMMLHDSASAFVIAHELGHALGLGHSNLLRCANVKNDGPWGDECKAIEYGGTIDIMGNDDVDTPLSSYHLWRLGYIDNSQVKQSWLSETISLTASDVLGPTRAIFLRDGNATYWVEYRRANSKADYRAGLVIYRTDPPPPSAVISPNADDLSATTAGPEVSPEIWMLNWDNYTYARSQGSGSMSLPAGSIATSFSGNISIVATPTNSPNVISVAITRRADQIAPPAPKLTDRTLWTYPDAAIIAGNYDDGQSAIASFDIDINGTISSLTASASESVTPTYLNPLSPPKTLRLKDLPEGNYSFSLRGVDIWGNKSPWSEKVSVYVDRGNPIVKADVTVTSASKERITLTWSGVRDSGIGLCSTTLHNEEGFVLSRSTAKSSPSFSFITGRDFAAKVQVFDCLGNGLSGSLSVKTGFVSASDSTRTGKWSAAPASYGPGALKCTGKCSASISIGGTITAMMGDGSADILVTSKSVAKVAPSTSGQTRSIPALSIGPGKKVVRIQGSNFVFAGIAQLDFSLGAFTPLAKTPEFPDPSLADPIQKKMSALGFNAGDFTQEWTLLPMARGTTLQDPTLDLCASTYVSESGRQIRRQVSATRVGSPYAFLSTEAVKYTSIEAASAALAELKKNYEACVTNKGGTENGVFTEYAFQGIPMSSAVLVDEKSRVIVRATIGKGLAARQLLGIYQYKGAYFTGLYVVLPGEKVMADAEVSRWLDVAAIMASRLESVAGGA